MSKILYWILSWTWGFLMTLIGSLIFGLLRLVGFKPRSKLVQLCF